jgi:hypothetical protein
MQQMIERTTSETHNDRFGKRLPKVIVNPVIGIGGQRRDQRWSAT